MSKIKINILSPGRFHVCDLARELDHNGFDVKFYSFVPTKRAESFGLPRKCCCSLLYPLAPFLALEKVLFKGQRWASQLRIKVQDLLAGLVMRKCDVCISMSGDFLFAPRMAKRKGATIIIERGSKHILEQRRILESIPSLRGKKPVPDMNVKRELACYELADYIAIASEHVKRSFLSHNYPEQKLFVNPYGVDLSDFYPANQEKEKKYDVIMVGRWCYRKGCDLIVEAIRKVGVKFLHVGSIGDMPFPSGTNFTHVNAVNQKELINYYHQAKVFLFPSREDGFGMVLSQAVACNLPVVGSLDCGAPDLKEMVALPDYITLIDDYTPEAVTEALRKSLVNYEQLKNFVYVGSAIEELTWKSYGNRYANFLNTIDLPVGGGKNTNSL